jgi:orotidine-5'-phosphate decarboxylase
LQLPGGRSALLVHSVSRSGEAGASPIIFALDFPDAKSARAAARAVRDHVGMIKVGLELFVADGPGAIELGREVGLPIFLDLKLHDIPETVERAVSRAAHLGVRFLTVHASGGPAMLRRAAERARSEGTGLEIVAVTVLTSMDEGDLARIGVVAPAEEQVRRLARMAYDEGVQAMVCSAREMPALRRDLGNDAILIAPGIRPSSPETNDDQKRVATATRAIEEGADWLVVGRPIRDAKDPARAAEALAQEAGRARAARAKSTVASPTRSA